MGCFGSKRGLRGHDEWEEDGSAGEKGLEMGKGVRNASNAEAGDSGIEVGDLK